MRREQTAAATVHGGGIEEAIRHWQEVLSREQISDDPATLDLYGRSCEITAFRPTAVLYPDATWQIQEILRIANQFRVGLHPISKGKNWGYGSACPITENIAVLDLGRMNRIIEVNVKLAYAVVEPGVTQAQLHSHLIRNQIPLTMDVTGASPDASILGNLVERGYGQTPYGDHFLHSSSMEVVLADGTIVQTGFGHFSANRTRFLYKWGIGPYLDGLFTQSNFGIITKVGVWLMPKPQYQGILLIQIPSDKQLGTVVERLRDLKLRGLLPSTMHISNDVRILSCFQQYPFDATGGKTPLPENVRHALRKKWGIACWSAFTGLRGSYREVRTDLSEIRQSLKPLGQITFISEDRIRVALRWKRLFSFFGGMNPQKAQPLFSLVTGTPTITPTLGAYWRKRQAPVHLDYDPPRDRCGIIWCAPIIPATAQDTSSLLEMTNRLMELYGFETNITITLISERACSATIGIVFDQENSNEMEQAHRCYRQMLEEFVQTGYIPYRHGTNVEEARDILFKENDTFWALCRKMKDCLDPNHILSPGKYGLY